MTLLKLIRIRDDPLNDRNLKRASVAASTNFVVLMLGAVAEDIALLEGSELIHLSEFY